MIVIFYRSDGRGFIAWERLRDERHFPKCTGSGYFFLRVLSSVGWDTFVETGVVALGVNCAIFSPSQIDVVPYPGSHRVDVCLYCAGVIPVETRRHSSPPHFFFCIGGPACDWDCVLSMHVVGRLEESITLLCYRCLASFPRNAYDRMSYYSQLATSSSMK